MTIAICVAAGQSDQVKAEVASLMKDSPGFTLAHAPQLVPFRDGRSLERCIALLSKAGVPK